VLSRSLGEYDGALRDILHALKYAGRRSLGPELARLLLSRCARALDGADMVVPVPLHWRRRWRRGFNQSALLAGGLGLPVVHALRRARHTPSQTALPASSRRANVRGAFRVRAAARASLPGACVVLVDDVTTTGATLEACGRVLIEAGVREVRALTAARVAPRRQTTPRP
jgi:ComF family protein